MRAYLPSVGRQQPPTGLALLNEVLFLPVGDAPQFVELKNAGNVAANLGGYRLRNEQGGSYSLPPWLPLPPAGVLLILFDGQNRVDQQIIHASLTGFLDASSGYVDLVSSGGALLDRVAWGEGQLYPVRLSQGGRAIGIAPGTTIGRYPLSTALGPAEWATFAPDQTTPGAPNPQPWRASPLAAQRRDHRRGGGRAALVSCRRRRALPRAGLRGRVLCRAGRRSDGRRAAAGAGAAQPRRLFLGACRRSPPNGAAASYSPPYFLSMVAQAPGEPLAGPMLSAIVPVPMIRQHKDTRMLMLELNRETGEPCLGCGPPDARPGRPGRQYELRAGLDRNGQCPLWRPVEPGSYRLRGVQGPEARARNRT